MSDIKEFAMNLEEYCDNQPIKVGQESLLLIDNTFVEDSWDVKRILRTPQKHPGNPLVVADLPWEDQVCNCSVIYDEDAQRYRMWYHVMDRSAWMHQFTLNDWTPEHGMPYFCAYAESFDGVNWEKPLFDDKPYREFKKTNVVLIGEQKVQAPIVTPVPAALDRTEKFMLMYKDNLPDSNGALCLAYSNDGVHWEKDPRNPCFTHAKDTQYNMIHDSLRQRWLLFGRPGVLAGKTGMADHPEHNFKRRTAVSVGKTPFDLSFPRTIIWPDELDQPYFDNMNVDRVGSHFVGFQAQMSPMPKMEFDIHLVFSHDGLHWQHLAERSPWIARGAQGSYDAGSTSSCSRIVTVGDKSYVYYRSGTRGQGGSEDNYGGVCRVEFPKERLIGQAGSERGGFILTREMVVAGPKLCINVHPANPYSIDNPDLSHCYHELKVEILEKNPDNKQSRKIPGFTFDECCCQPVNLLDYHVTWENNNTLDELIGKPVYIRFFLKNMTIYSMRFSD